MNAVKPLKMNQWNTCRIHFSNGGICMYFSMQVFWGFVFSIPKALTLPQHHSPPTPTHLFHRGQKAYAVRRGGWNLQDFRDGGVQLILLVPPGRKTSRKPKKKRNENPKILSNSPCFSTWAVLKTSCDFVLITWSFAKTFRHSFANASFSTSSTF